VFTVNDGDRTLKFDGVVLGHSSSFSPEAERWVEFDLYRTAGGTYVVARTGYSVLFHAEGCGVLRKGRHRPAQVATLTADSRPCSLCNPQVSVDQAHELIYPETPIHWAQVCQSSVAVIEALAKYDTSGNRYFTNVARELIRQAAELDTAINEAYYVEQIS
jgi:hypothetical protein